MKRKIIALKVLTFILAFLIVLIEGVLFVFLLKYFIDNDHLIIGVFLAVVIFTMLTLILISDIGSDYKDFEEKEVNTWEKLTVKRTVKFMFKYYLYFIKELLKH